MFPLHDQKFVTHRAIEMHNTFEVREQSTESCDTNGSLGSSLPSRDNRAL